MTSRKRKKEIVVPPPSPRPRRRGNLIENTIVTERLNVLAMSTRIGKYTSFLVIVVGTLLLLLSTQFILSELETPLRALSLLDVSVLFAAEQRIIAAVIFGFVAVVNVFCGLLMLATE